MKAKQQAFPQIAADVARKAHTFFFCGPDEAGAFAAADRILESLPDPGERIELAGADLKKDPVLLGDEARSGSLFGGSRHIFVRVQGDDAHDAVANHIAAEVPGCPVLIVATGATDKSRTAKLLADRPDALVTMFHPPDLDDIARAVRAMADAAGLGFDSGIAQRIAQGAGLDLRLAQSEVNKLALYLDAAPTTPRRVDRAALDAIGAPTDDDGFGPLVDTVLGGHRDRLAEELRRMHEVGVPIAFTW